MQKRDAAVLAVCGALAGSIVSSTAGCQSTPSRAAESMVAVPIDGWEGVKNVTRAGAVTFAAQPTEAALEQYAAEGGTMVIDLRTHTDADGAPFDEPAKVTALGMDYSPVPMSPGSFSSADVKLFVVAMREARGPVLVHCGSSNRVGGMWAAYLALEKGWETEAAMEAGRAAGMRSPDMEAAARRVIGR